MPRLRLFVFFVCGFFLSYLYRSVNAVLAPDLAREFSLSADRLGLLTSLFLLTFALVQPVLGALLDRFGPRRVESALLLVAATGAALFATADGLAALALGRALIGVGTSACLMAGLLANAMWFSGHRLALVNGLFMGIGGLGAVSAGAPIEMALGWTDWRGVMGALALATFALGAIQFLGIPERTARGRPANLLASLQGIATVYRSRTFWRVAPLTMLSQGSGLAYAGLWAGPWFTDVAGLDRTAMAVHLSVLSAAVVAGFFLSGVATHWLERAGLTIKQIAGGGMGTFVAMQALIVAWPGGPTLWLWAAYGCLSVTGVMTYTILPRHFGVALAGRANTACSLLIFACAFAIQAGTGLLLEPFATDTPGHFTVDGHRLALGLVTALQFFALLWYMGFRDGRRAGVSEQRAAQV